MAKKEPLAEQKLFHDLDKLTGDEGYADGCAWFKTMWNLAEVVMPGAGAILRSCADMNEEITADKMSKADDPSLVMNLSQTIHRVLYLKTKGKQPHMLNMLMCTEVSKPSGLLSKIYSAWMPRK